MEKGKKIKSHCSDVATVEIFEVLIFSLLSLYVCVKQIWIILRISFCILPFHLGFGITS